jgi:chromosomal replication initiation ATPase DnaA
MSLTAEAQERRQRLWNPPNGRHSSELEILSARALREKQLRDEAEKARKTAVIERFHRAQQVVKRALIHRRPQVQETGPDPLNPPLIDGSCTYPLTVRDICRACCRYYDVNMIDFVSARRHAKLARTRHVASYLPRIHTTRSLPEIGRIMGNRDHTTILSGVRKIDRCLLQDEALAEDIRTIRIELGIANA